MKDIPLTQKGTAKFMVANALAASLADYLWGLKPLQINTALQTFIPGYEITPGRMNIFECRDFKVLVDYAHNPHGYGAIKEYLANVDASRKIGIIIP